MPPFSNSATAVPRYASVDRSSRTRSRRRRTTTLFLCTGAVALLYVNLELFLNPLVRWTPAHSSAPDQWIDMLGFPVLSDKEPLDDWFNAEAWESNPYTKSCIVLDDICHSSHRWFHKNYRRAKGNGDRTTDGPQYELQLFKKKIKTGYPTHLVIEPAPPQHADANMITNCRDSPVTNHMILRGHYSHMLGEFYVRVLAGLYALLSHLQISHTISMAKMIDGENHSSLLQAFREHTQLYLHLDLPMLESHVLFTAAYRNTPLLDLKDLLHPTRCQCMKRLILCGYDVANKTTTMTEQQADSETETNSTTAAGVITDNPNNQDTNNRTLVLTPGGGFGFGTGKSGIPLMAPLRHQLRQEVLLNNPPTLQAIEAFRAQQFEAQNISALEADVDGWILVGLSQRTMRRKWTNLDMIGQLCDKKLRDLKVICIQVCVDDPFSNPFWQAIKHAAVDVLIGVHGAQLTEAVWMKPHSLVVELLPYIPYNLTGQWTRIAHSFTPLGLIYHETDLNHVGYRLPDTSVPDCLGLQEAEEEEKCFKATPWAKRDFHVSFTVVNKCVELYRTLIAPIDSSSTAAADSCQDWENFLNRRYNANGKLKELPNVTDDNTPVFMTSKTDPSTKIILKNNKYTQDSTDEFIFYNVNCRGDLSPTLSSLPSTMDEVESSSFVLMKDAADDDEQRRAASENDFALTPHHYYWETHANHSVESSS